jgi:hypothetical protein
MLIKLGAKIMEVVKSNIMDRLRSEAQKELDEEFESKAKEKMKIKLRDLRNAQKLVANLQRELEDLQLELAD